MISLIEDTRQKKDKHALKNRIWESEGVHVVRCALPFGDYMAVPKVVVDTKQDILEIAGNLCGCASEKRRVREEIKKANDAGCKLIFLIEDKRFHEIDDLYGRKFRLHNGQTIPGDQLAVAMTVMQERYQCEFWFSDPKESARVIRELLEDGYGK